MNRKFLRGKVKKEDIDILKNDAKSFVAFLQDENESTVIHVLEKLGRLESGYDKKPLLTLLRHKNENISDRATFAVTEVNPAGNQVDYACKLNMPLRTIEPTKSTNCYVNYYGSSASVSCY